MHFEFHEKQGINGQSDKCQLLEEVPAPWNFSEMFSSKLIISRKELKTKGKPLL
jgi:hypothetical protein